jgi:hypothetical protein
MNYKIVQNNKTFIIVETSTNQNIKTFSSSKDAKTFMRHLNLGGGFDGNTPPFFLIPVNKSLYSI